MEPASLSSEEKKDDEILNKCGGGNCSSSLARPPSTVSPQSLRESREGSITLMNQEKPQREQDRRQEQWQRSADDIAAAIFLNDAPGRRDIQGGVEECGSPPLHRDQITAVGSERRKKQKKKKSFLQLECDPELYPHDDEWPDFFDQDPKEDDEGRPVYSLRIERVPEDDVSMLDMSSPVDEYAEELSCSWDDDDADDEDELTKDDMRVIEDFAAEFAEAEHEEPQRPRRENGRRRRQEQERRSRRCRVSFSTEAAAAPRPPLGRPSLRAQRGRGSKSAGRTHGSGVGSGSAAVCRRSTLSQQSGMRRVDSRGSFVSVRNQQGGMRRVDSRGSFVSVRSQQGGMRRVDSRGSFVSARSQKGDMRRVDSRGSFVSVGNRQSGMRRVESRESFVSLASRASHVTQGSCSDLLDGGAPRGMYGCDDTNFIDDVLMDKLAKIAAGEHESSSSSSRSEIGPQPDRGTSAGQRRVSDVSRGSCSGMPSDVPRRVSCDGHDSGLMNELSKLAEEYPDEADEADLLDDDEKDDALPTDSIGADMLLKQTQKHARTGDGGRRADCECPRDVPSRAPRRRRSDANGNGNGAGGMLRRLSDVSHERGVDRAAATSGSSQSHHQKPKLITAQGNGGRFKMNCLSGEAGSSATGDQVLESPSDTRRTKGPVSGGPGTAPEGHSSPSSAGRRAAPTQGAAPRERQQAYNEGRRITNKIPQEVPSPSRQRRRSLPASHREADRDSVTNAAAQITASLQSSAGKRGIFGKRASFGMLKKKNATAMA